MNRFDKWLEKSRWVMLPTLYVIICVWTYFTATVEINGITLSQHEAGVYGLIALHVIGFLAVLGAYILHWIVELIARIFK